MKKIILSIAAALAGLITLSAQENATPEYGYKQTGFASTPKFGAYIIGSYKYSDREGAHDGDGFNARLIRAYVDGSIFNDFNYRVQVELNGTPHVKDFFFEWAKYKAFSVKMGQFKRAFTFENPMNPWDVGVGDFSLLVKKLAGMGDRCGEASMGGRDLGIQFQGDLLPIGKDKHSLFHYQLGIYNGNGINRADNNADTDIIGTLQIQPIKGLWIGAFGWKGNWSNGTVTVDRRRYSFGAKYDHDNWTVRTEYAKSFGYKASEYYSDAPEDPSVAPTWHGTGLADAFYFTFGIPVKDWLKLYAKWDEYRDQGTKNTSHDMVSWAANFRLHKNLNIQLEYRWHNDQTISDSNYNELWLQTYIRW